MPVVVAAVLVRAAYLLAYLHSPLAGVYRIDQLYYRTWGLEIAGGRWIGAGAFEQSPLYAYLLGLFYRLCGPLDPLLFALQLLTGVATAFLIAVSARRLFGQAAGMFAGALAAVYGPFVFYECAVMKTFLEPLLVLAALAAGLRALDSPRGRWPAVAGAALGLAALVREVHVLLVPPLLAALWMRRPEPGDRAPAAPGARRLAAAGLALAAFAGTLAPAVLHNRLAGDEFVVVSAAGGENLYLGFGPAAKGFYNAPDFIGSQPYLEHQDFRDEAFLRTGRPHSRAASSRFWFGEAWRHVREEPLSAVGLVAQKAAVLLADLEIPDSENFTATRGYVPLLRALPTFGWIAGLGLLGVVLAAIEPRRPTLALGFAAALVAEVLVTFNLGRYRAAFAGIWLVFAGRAAAWLWAGLREGGRPRARAAAVATGAAVVTALSFLRPYGLEASARDRELDRFRREATRNAELRDAIGEARRELAADPGNPELALNLGMLMELTGRLPEAVSLYREAVRNAPTGIAQRVRLTDLLLRQNRPGEATPHARALASFAPQEAIAFVFLGRIELLEAANARDREAALRPLSQAVDALRVAVRLDPGDVGPRVALARAEYLAGEMAAAGDDLRAALAIDPGSRAAHSLAGTILAR